MGNIITVTKENAWEVIFMILEKLKKNWEIKISLEWENQSKSLKIKPEVEKSWYKDPNNPKRFDYDVVEKEFKSVDELINFLRN